jgi:hypothetical protein
MLKYLHAYESKWYFGSIVSTQILVQQWEIPLTYMKLL